MNEPDDLTGWVDRFGGTWVRVDDCPGPYGDSWWSMTACQIGDPCDWDMVEFDYGPLTPADGAVTAETIELVRQEWSR